MNTQRIWKGILPFVGALALIAVLLLALPGQTATVSAAPSATTLGPGDIAIIGFNFDNPDEFAFVLLTDITAGTEIHFTDNGWLAAGGFRTGEGEDVWTAGTDMSAGTVVTLTTSSMAFSSGGDQIIAFQGSLSTPSLIYALNSEGSGWQSDATSSNTSALPTGLTDGYTAIALNEIDNAKYDVSNGTSGTKDALLSLISNTANWSGSNSTRQDLTFPSFTVTGGGSTASLSVSKAGPSVAAPGDSLVYTVTVASQGMTVTNVIVTDTLPMSVTFDSASLPYGNPSTGVYTFSLGEIVSGTQSAFNITVTVDAGITTPASLTNTVTVSTTEQYTGTAEFVTAIYPLVSIHDIQYVSDPASDDASPYNGQTVFVEGIVVAAPGELGSRAMVIEDAAGGPWSGLYVYDSGNFSGLSVARGDKVRVLGSVTEYYGMTEFAYSAAETLSTGNTLPDPAVVSTGDFVSAGTAEQWESVYLEFQNATVTNPDLGYGEWAFDDGSGATRADDMGSFTYTPALGDYYNFIRGIGWYSYSNYKLEPRDDNDFFVSTPPNDLGVTKSGPSYALAGDTLTYTIQVQNPLLVAAENVVLTDTLPVSVTNVLSSSNALTVTNLGSEIVWEFGQIGAGVTETVYLTVTAPASAPNGFILTNSAVVTTTSTDDPANNTAAVNTNLYAIVPIATARAGADGDTFAVEGKVIVVPGTYNGTEWELQDASGGIAVYDYPPPALNLGDTVRLIGTRGTYKGQEQFSDVLYFTNLGPGVEVSPLITTTGAVDSGSTEGWLVQVQGTLSGLNCPGDRSFYVDDGTGDAYVYVDADTGADMCSLGAVDGDTATIVGFSTEYNGTFEIKPRRPADLALLRSAPAIYKTAPSNVDPGAAFTYTLTVENYLGMPLTNVVITDTVSSDLSGVTPLDGGAYANGIITWTVASLADQSSVDVHFTATAPITVGTMIVNERYAMTAAEWVTPTFGTPVHTFVGDYTPIPDIQGDGMLSPFEGETVKTEGVVVGFFEGNSSAAGNFNGFFIQDPSGDGDPKTSDAVFVNYGTTSFSGVSVGDMVVVTGTVQEFSEWDGAACYGDACLTQVAVDTANIRVIGTDSVTATILTPPGDPVTSTLYFESLEGMLVTIPDTATVVGPTSYNTIQVVPGSLGVDRVMRGGPYEGMPVGVRPDERYGNGASDLIVGSVVSGVDGPLTYSYGDYLIADQDGYSVVVTATLPETIPSWAAPTPIQFTAATMNTYNFDSQDPTLKATKMVSQVLQMNAPTFLALEEIAAADVLPGIVADLAAAGYPYDFAYSHPDVGGHGVALMWRTDMVTNVVTSTAYQGCSPDGSSSSTYDPMWDTCQAMGEYPLFSRRPVVLTATVNLASGPQQVVVIANHFKSKRGGSLSADMRRLEQGQFVHTLAAQFEQNTPNVLMMGDLNDFEDSPPLQALYADGVFTNTWFTLPEEARYSYIYQGVSQILDHILVSPALLDELDAMSPMHFNADFPYNPYYGDAVIWRNSDHDPVIATFTSPYRAILPVIFREYTP